MMRRIRSNIMTWKERRGKHWKKGKAGEDVGRSRIFGNAVAQ
jgi:hypothetical protein